MNVTISYSRVSTDKQDTDNQAGLLMTAFPNSIFVCETASGIRERPELDRACTQLAPGDTLAVVAIDRLGRSSIDILSRIKALTERGVIIHSLREGKLDNTPSGKFLIAVLAAAAELERNLISERTKAGMARVKSQGVKVGRPRSDKAPEVLALLATGLSQRQVARKLEVSVGYVNRLANS